MKRDKQKIIDVLVRCPPPCGFPYVRHEIMFDTYMWDENQLQNLSYEDLMGLKNAIKRSKA